MHQANDSLDVWRRIGGYWDDQVGEGNPFQTELVMPATDELLAIRPGERVLDACCGNGNYSRRLAARGASVVAFDGSETLVERGRSKSPSSIEYRVIDACSDQALGTLDGPFDAAVCSFALMDLPTIAPLLKTVRRLLNDSGRFVWSIGHPAFHTNEATPIARQQQGEGEAVQTFGVEVTRYASDWPHKSRGILGQPEPHWIYHRSLSTLVSECVAAGFVIDGMREPTFKPDTRARSPFAWARRPEIPPAVVVRLRPV